MLACRCLFRVDRVLKFTSTSVQSKRVNYLQGYCSYYSFSRGEKDKQSAMGGNRKWKIINPVWRPVCTQANSIEECLVKNVTVETGDGTQVQIMVKRELWKDIQWFQLKSIHSPLSLICSH